MKRIPLAGVFALALCVGVGSAADAAPASRGMFASTADGLKGNPPPVIKVWPGASLDLDFLPTGEIIRKIWLDDESRIAIEDDSCLVESAVSSGQQGGQSDDCGARVLHLRQVKRSKNSALTYGPYGYLTLINETPRGTFKRYRFQIVAVGPVRDRSGRWLAPKPEYTSVTVHPDSAGTAFIDLGAGSRRATIDDVLRGLASARSSGLVPENSPLIGKVREFVAAVRGGEPLEGSARAAGLSMAFVTRLAGMGLAGGGAPPASENGPVGNLSLPQNQAASQNLSLRGASIPFGEDPARR
ncbi:hypothetical protein [Gloeobacter morelensis]|uniref:hypothetical protein n=1 Tax=Gloeobacter morelensis TaxID=2907343 RepID=UPI001E302C05|nr:hypothetical protein [Gloeobacter morelensis]UFP97136.1 hypothetical protein ISF26_23735 [Gloeobacter morelensis MG652769]